MFKTEDNVGSGHDWYRSAQQRTATHSYLSEFDISDIVGVIEPSVRCGQIGDPPPDPRGGPDGALGLLVDVLEVELHLLLALSERFPVSMMVWRHFVETVQ